MDQVMPVDTRVRIFYRAQLKIGGRQEQVGQEQVDGSGRSAIDGHGFRTARSFLHVIAGMCEARGAE